MFPNLGAEARTAFDASKIYVICAYLFHINKANIIIMLLAYM